MPGILLVYALVILVQLILEGMLLSSAYLLLDCSTVSPPPPSVDLGNRT